MELKFTSFWKKLIFFICVVVCLESFVIDDENKTSANEVDALICLTLFVG